jgi:2-polyprenyl-3-methyl-5-hydroxy-6-metoxy-1,4-benzoquinol methylase
MPTHLATCEQCGIKFAIPRCSQNEIEMLYKKGGYWKKYTENIFTPSEAPGEFIQSAIRWRFILQHTGNSLFDILDVGAGYGFLGQAVYRTARERLHSYTVVEKDAYFLNSLKRTWSREFSDINFKAYSDLRKVEGEFNLIALSHILEHLTNPFDYLKLVQNLLTKNGTLFIEVPFLDYQFKNDLFPHLLFFDPISLRLLCERAGFNVLTVQSFGALIAK